MAEQTVTYLIGKDGKITVEVNGVKGAACRELVRDTVEKLGVELSTELKPEYFELTGKKNRRKTVFKQKGEAVWRPRCGWAFRSRADWLPFWRCRFR